MNLSIDNHGADANINEKVFIENITHGAICYNAIQVDEPATCKANVLINHLSLRIKITQE